MELSIAIVNWNTREMLAHCLASVYTHLPRIETEVFVVDNASTDGSPAMVREQFSQVRLIENDKNVGFARANNQVLQECNGRYILLLNSDTEIRPNALQELVDFMERHPEAGGAGPYILNPDNTLQTSCYPAPTLTREFWRMLHLDAIWPYGIYRMDKWSTHTHREVEAILGACFILRRDILEQVGRIDEAYFMYTEEIDLCHRIRKAGWHIYWVPQAHVVHYGGQSTRQAATEMFLKLYETKVLYFRKHHGWLAVQAYKSILLITTLARLLFSPLILLERGPRRRRHQALAGQYGQLVVALWTM